MKRILVTGGAGFIGSNLIEKLLKDKSTEKVICVDNFDPFYSIAFKKDNIKKFLNSKKFEFYKTDITDLSSLSKIFKKEKPDRIIHLAAKVDTRNSVKYPYDYNKVNVLGTLHLLELSKYFEVKKFIFISSSSVYGNEAEAPFKENKSANLPLTPYGVTKVAGELLCYTYFHNFNLPVICLRIFNAYGERNRPDLVIYKWVQSILNNNPIEMSGKGARSRDYTYVGDIVEAILLALKKDIGYQTVNIGNSKPISLKILLSKIEDTLGRKAVVKNRPSARASAESTCADITKAKKLLGWKPKISMEEGLKRFAMWFKKERLNYKQ